MAKIPVSVCMVIHHEEALLKRALDSCADIVDDIVIVHDGPCSDKSLEIARKYTDKVFTREKMGAPEPHRPFSFSQAKNQWILQFDADEYLQEDFRKALPELIKKDVPGYMVKWLEEIDGKLFLNMTKEVLFQKDQVYFLGAPCEYVKPVDPHKKLSFAPVGLVNSAKVSFYQSKEVFKNKYSRFARLQASFYTKSMNEIPQWNYPFDDLEPRTRLKVDHPLLLGIGGMNMKYFIELIKNIMGIPTETSLPATFNLMWYNTILYWNVFTINHRI